MEIISDFEINNMTKNSQKSELWKYKESIEKMRVAGITYRVIRSWLGKNNIETSSENIRQFYLRNCEKDSVRKPNNKMQTEDKEVLDMFGNI